MAFELRLNPVRPPAHLPFWYCRKRTLTTPMNGPGKSMDFCRKMLCDGRRLRTTARSASCRESEPSPRQRKRTTSRSRRSNRGGRAKSHWTVKVDKKTASFTSKGKGRGGSGSSAHGPCSAAAGDRERREQSGGCRTGPGARTGGAGCISTGHKDWRTGGAGCSTRHISCGTGGCDTRGW